MTVRPAITPLERGPDCFLRLPVQGRSGLIEQQDWRGLQQGASNGDTLPLTAGKLRSAIPDQGLHAVGQRIDKFEAFGGGGGRYDLFIRRIGPRIADVLHDRAVEE